MTKINTTNIRRIGRLGKVKTGLNSVKMGNVLNFAAAQESLWEDSVKRN